MGVGLSKPEGDAGYASDRADEGAGGAISALWLSARWPMVVPGSLEADNHGSADAAEPIDEPIMLSAGIQYDKSMVAT
jgi:hypothetical protein